MLAFEHNSIGEHHERKGRGCFVTLPPKLSSSKAVLRKEGHTSHFAWVRPEVPFTFQLDPLVTLGGKVVDPDGAPIAGAQLEVTWSSTQAGVPRAEYQLVDR